MYFFIKRSVVGHSLGAAIATHCVAHLIKAGYKITLFENYGSPRVGDKAFSNWFQQIFPNVLKPRVTHGKDPVPHLPPMEWGFQHVPTEIFY
jgi:predicted lipase